MKASTKNKDLEKWRGTFFQTGLIIALGISLVAFEWQTEKKHLTLSGMGGFSTVIEDIIPITVQKPILPPAPIPQPVTVFTVVDDNRVVIDDIIIDAGDDQFKPILPYVPPILPEPEPEGEPDFFIVAEVMPSFPSGYSAMQAFLSRHIRYPEVARGVGIAGTVHIKFIVDTDGRITNVEILRGIGGGCDEEALRVVSQMPRWEPGRQRGKAVRVSMSIPVKFTLI